ncbi:hypothetical protein BH23PLA1_BH23PLA1_09920 [soil metagenome]
MPSVKAKTHKGTKKRFKATATGKVMHKRCGSSHLNSGKGGKKIRQLRRKGVLVVQAEARRLRRALGVHHSSLTNGLSTPPPSDPAPESVEATTQEQPQPQS